MKDLFKKITAVSMAIMIFLCCFTACNKKTDPSEEITKGTDEIEVPSQDLVDFDEYDIPTETESSTEETAVSSTKPSESEPISTPAGVTKPSNAPESTTNTSATTQETMVGLLKAAGYLYDEEQDIYYSTLNPWQRHFGFTGEYDTAASYLNMEYVTFKCDFKYDNKYWRIQCWKGQYALLCGAEMGVYTKDINSDLSEDFYACANNDNLLEMGFDFYKTTKDYNSRNRLFYRPLEYHWWQTGFKFGYCNPTNCVVVMTLYAKDTAMADGIEQGLQNVKNKNGKLNPFYKYGTKAAQGKANIYKREGNEFKIIWVNAGYTNYSGSMI